MNSGFHIDMYYVMACPTVGISPALSQMAKGLKSTVNANPSVVEFQDRFVRQSQSVCFGATRAITEQEIAFQMDRHLRRLREVAHCGKRRFLEDPLAQDAASYNMAQLGQWTWELRKCAPKKVNFQLFEFRGFILHNATSVTPPLLWHNMERVLRQSRRATDLQLPEGYTEELLQDELRTVVLLRLERIAACLDKAQTRRGFIRDQQLRDAIAYNLGIVGEVAKKLDSLRISEEPDIQESLLTLRQVRNHLVHPEKYRNARKPDWLWQTLITRTNAATAALHAFLAAPE